MNGCTINSKDRCRESGAHGVAKNLLFTQKYVTLESSRTKVDVSTPHRKQVFLYHRETLTFPSSLSSLPPSFEERPPTPALVSFPLLVLLGTARIFDLPPFHNKFKRS
ncbi:hypothetical protein ALC62_09466 [Cyphomyrmex costatus]|uniref:Uncharacterized protein n=1 Tax=Cyphomyrmex costatus TaxID=456900 RepID=A0A195CGK6_9HYME|nr:hypothetical protein ALC62_09466 [Cyphomyrmex costatus]